MKANYDAELCQLMKSLFPGNYFEAPALPKPYVGTGKIRAVLLGADPTFEKDNGKFEYVFGLENQNSPFFRNHVANLDQIGLDLRNLYVQNLIKSYFNHETSKNKVWEQSAYLWMENIKRELDDLFSRRIPILVTAEKIMKVLVYSNEMEGIKAKRIYSEHLYFLPDSNFFGRDVFAFYRHYNYQLKNWPEYAGFIKGKIPA